MVVLRVCVTLLGCVTSLYHVTSFALRTLMLPGHVTSLYNVTWLCYEFV